MLGMNETRLPVNESGLPDNDVGLPNNDSGPPNNEHGQPDLGPPENEPGPPENEPELPDNEPGPSSNKSDSATNVTAPPVHPHFVTPTTRLESFWPWPISLATRPSVLYKVGFFYTGRSDRTVCFQCGVEICNWMDSDDPWIVHAKRSPKCLHVLESKGRDFVENVLRNEKSLAASRDLKNVNAPAGSLDSSHTIPSKSRFGNGSAGASRGAVKKTGCCVRSKGEQGKGSKAKALKGSLAKSESPDEEDSNTETAKNSDSKVKDGTTSKRNDAHISDNRLCKICWQGKLGVAFLPCGHLIACAKCAASLEKCAVCCQCFTSVVHISVP